MNCEYCGAALPANANNCPACGAPVSHPGSVLDPLAVTIYGYHEWYLFPLDISIYHDGVCIGKVGRNEKIVVKVPRGDSVTFKWAWKQASIRVDTPTIILSTNRITGQISARLAPE